MLSTHTSDLRILSLRLRNFKGARSVDLEAAGADVDVFGDNGAGKTTIADAFFWLLFGKDSLNRSDFEIKTIDPETGQPFHNLEHSVEAVLDAAGTPLTLKRTYREVYTKKRGSAQQEFGGHTTDYLINGVPVQMKEFASRVSEICSEKRFRMLTDPAYFNGVLPWQDRRAMLLAVCGDVTDADVIAGHPALSELPAILGQHSIDDYRKILAARRKEINEELGKVPVRIDEANRSLSGAKAGDWQAIADQAASKLRELNERRAAAAAGGEVAELAASLKLIEAEMVGIEAKIRSRANPEREQAVRRKRDLEDQAVRLDSQIRSMGHNRDDALRTKEAAERKRTGLRAQWKSENERSYSGSDSCPACGQALPADKVQAAVDAFNEAKARKLSEIQIEGKAAASRVDELAAQAASFDAEISKLQQERDSIAAELASLRIPEDKPLDPGNDADYIAKGREREDVERRLSRLRADGAGAVVEVDRQIAQVQSELSQAQEAIAAAKRDEETRRRIDELKSREKQLSAEFEELERELFLTEEFVRAKVSMLTERINGRFSICRFRLFEEQVNGGLSECCVATVGGVPFDAGLNHGACVNAGIECIDVLAGHLGFAAPIFVDGCESVTRLIPTQGQQIRLIVSASDKDLRIVPDDPRPAALKPEEALF